MSNHFSVNQVAWKLTQKFLDHPETYNATVSKTAGATIIDVGVNAKGGFEAGKKLTEICLGGAGKAKLDFKEYGNLVLPSITITTDHPAVAALGSQFAGWRIKEEDGSIAIGSGPARALALKPKDLFEAIGYQDQSDKAVLVLECNKLPTEKLIEKVTTGCKVAPENLRIVAASTASIAGLTQVTGRIVEVGIHKLRTLGLDPKIISNAWGYAPISPQCQNFDEAMGRTNDAILYGGTVYFSVDFDDETKLKEIVEKAPSCTSKDYGKPFLTIFREAQGDFYKIDHGLFAPAQIIVNNAKTGKSFCAGRKNEKILAQSLGL